MSLLVSQHELVGLMELVQEYLTWNQLMVQVEQEVEFQAYFLKNE
jgi:hypothetical protein